MKTGRVGVLQPGWGEARMLESIRRFIECGAALIVMVAAVCGCLPERRVTDVRDLDQLTIACRRTGNLHGAPECGGHCPDGQICRSVITPLREQACECRKRLFCWEKEAPACGGTCPFGGECHPGFVEGTLTCHCDMKGEEGLHPCDHAENGQCVLASCGPGYFCGPGTIQPSECVCRRMGLPR